jgi:hypothetical protein
MLRLILLLASFSLAATHLLAAEPPAEKAPPIIRIARETTHFTEPLWPDGSVNYAAAVNAIAGKGVARESNACSAWLSALGPRAFENMPEEYPDKLATLYRLIGMQPLPKEGKYFIEHYPVLLTLPWVKDPNDMALFDRFQASSSSPWSGKEAPDLAAWIERNQVPLDQMVIASRRTGWYRPFVPEAEQWLGGQLIPEYPHQGHSHHALVSRAMGRIQDGKLAEARGDLVAALRLARLKSRELCAVGTGLGFTMEDRALVGCEQLARHAGFVPPEAELLLAGLREAPGRPSLRETFVAGQRAMALDCMQAVALYGPHQLSGSREPEMDAFSLVRDTVYYGMTDWSEAMRFVNQGFDRLDAALATPGPHARRARLAAESKAIDEECRRWKHPLSVWNAVLDRVPLRTASGRQKGSLVLDLLQPNVESLYDLALKLDAREAALRTALIVIQHQPADQRFVERLDDLPEKLRAMLPPDPFGDGRALCVYRRTDTGFAVFSVGPNGKDNGGPARDGDESLSDDIGFGLVRE